jgi:hypothetical protein
LHIGGDAAHLAGADDHIALVIAPEIKPRLFELGIVDLLNPFPAAARPILIDEELIVIFDEKLGRVTGIFLAVAEQAAADHEIAGKDRGAALSDQPLAENDNAHVCLVQVEGGIGSGGSAADDRDVSLKHHERVLHQPVSMAACPRYNALAGVPPI